MDQRSLHLRAALRSGNPGRALAVVEHLALGERLVVLRRTESMIRHEMALAHAPVSACGGLADPAGYERELGAVADLRQRTLS